MVQIIAIHNIVDCIDYQSHPASVQRVDHSQMTHGLRMYTGSRRRVPFGAWTQAERSGNSWLPRDSCSTLASYLPDGTTFAITNILSYMNNSIKLLFVLDIAGEHTFVLLNSLIISFYTSLLPIPFYYYSIIK